MILITNSFLKLLQLCHQSHYQCSSSQGISEISGDMETYYYSVISKPWGGIRPIKHCSFVCIWINWRKGCQIKGGDMWTLLLCVLDFNHHSLVEICTYSFEGWWPGGRLKSDIVSPKLHLLNMSELFLLFYVLYNYLLWFWIIAGGTFALYSLLCRHAKVGLLPSDKTAAETMHHEEIPSKIKMRTRARWAIENHKSCHYFLLLLALVGSCLIICDGVLTPSISGLSHLTSFVVYLS